MLFYDVEEAKRELTYLFGVIDMFNMSDAEKKKFLEEIMQYWILSVKDAKWSGERERRYVIFMYDDYDYRETEIDDTFLKVKTSIFLTPDFIIGKNPSRYRNYVDYYFEYNKENELICSQFIDKQIYGNSGLDVFIKKGFKTNEEINVNKTLIPAYLALVLSLGITLWQYFNTDNSDIITIQNQLTEIQQTLYDNSPPDITEIENKLQEIYDSSDITSINQQLEEILNEIKEYKQTP